MKENQKVSTDKKAPMDTPTEKNKNMPVKKEISKTDDMENKTKTASGKTSKSNEKFDAEKGKYPAKK
jgi:hypothetical protein